MRAASVFFSFHSNLCSFVCFVCFSVDAFFFSLFIVLMYERVWLLHVKNAPVWKWYHGNEHQAPRWTMASAKSDTPNKNNNSSRTFRMCLCVTWVNFNWIILIWFETKRSTPSSHTHTRRMTKKDGKIPAIGQPFTFGIIAFFHCVQEHKTC